MLQGYGMATLPDTPATTSTIWYGASTTKAFTAALLAQMIDSKAYDQLKEKGWQTPISSIIPDDFVLQDPWRTQTITLEDAASHRTGMARHDRSSIREHDDGTQVSIREIVRNLRNLPIHEPPRVKFLYNNFMYVTLSHVIETLRGETMTETLRKEVWEPLGMNDTYFSLSDVLESRNHLASGYYWHEKEARFKEIAHMSVVEDGGAGAQFSSVLDYAKWVRCLLTEGEPFSKAVHADLKSPRMIESSPSGPFDITLYALGWQRCIYRNTPFYKHDGGMLAAGATVVWVPKLNFGVVGFANTALTSNAVLDILVWKLIDEKMETPSEERDTTGAKKYGLRSAFLPNADINHRWTDFLEKVKRDSQRAVEIVYPNLPEPKLPATVTASEAAGKYYDAGYKTLMLEEIDHPEKPGEKALRAERNDMTWRTAMELHHVSGDYWLLWAIADGIEVSFFKDYMRAEFRRGPDGKVSSLKVVMENRLGYQYEGPVSFKRIP